MGGDQGEDDQDMFPLPSFLPSLPPSPDEGGNEKKEERRRPFSILFLLPLSSPERVDGESGRISLRTFPLGGSWTNEEHHPSLCPSFFFRGGGGGMETREDQYISLLVIVFLHLLSRVGREAKEAWWLGPSITSRRGREGEEGEDHEVIVISLSVSLSPPQKGRKGE